ncbi:MAG: SRPBCC family protein [Methanosarcinales archaeon]|nr:SRPBCC family protein [Methanosarcinales archaeon]
MPESHIEFEVNAPIEKVWGVMSNPGKHTHCIPGLLSCEVTGPDTTLWIMEMQFGPFIKRVEMQSRNVEVDPPYYGTWEGKAKGIKMSGQINLKENSSSITQVYYRLELEPKSIFLLSLISFIEERLKRDVIQYARNVKYQLENNNKY